MAIVMDQYFTIFRNSSTAYDVHEIRSWSSSYRSQCILHLDTGTVHRFSGDARGNLRISLEQGFRHVRPSLSLSHRSIPDGSNGHFRYLVLDKALISAISDFDKGNFPPLIKLLALQKEITEESRIMIIWLRLAMSMLTLFVTILIVVRSFICFDFLILI